MKFISTIFILVVLLTFFSSSIAQVNWTKDANNNPILSPGSSGEFDDYSLFPSCILFDGSGYHLWFGGHDGTRDRIGYAESSDGLTWTKYESNPVLDVGSPGSWDDERIMTPYVLFDGETYHMWYGGHNGTNTRIGYATSTDRTTWTKYEDNPVMDTGPAGSWESQGVDPDCIYFDGTTYHLWYGGFNASGISCIGYATSPDGKTWTKHEGNPVLTPNADTWEEYMVGAPDVFFDGNTYHMWYTGSTTSYWWKWGGVGYATSPDGVTWTKYAENPILSSDSGEWDSQYVGFSRVIWDSTNSQYKMWYGGGSSNWYGKLGYATATKTILNVPDQYATIQNGIDAADIGDVVLVDEGTFYENINFKGKAITVASRLWFDDDTSHISKTIIDGSQPSHPDSGSVVFFLSGEDTTSVLCGFTITGGTGTEYLVTIPVPPYDLNVRAGAGITMFNSGATICHNRIIQNNLDDSQVHECAGGGIASGPPGNSSWTIIESNLIQHNSCENGTFSNSGGGLSITSNARVSANTIQDNQASSNTQQAVGGGLHFEGCDSIIVTDNTVVRNKAITNSTSQFGVGGGMYFMRKESAYIRVLRNILSLNQVKSSYWSAANGVGFDNVNGDVLFVNNIIHNNYYSGNHLCHGGGIYLTNAEVRIINNTFTGNKAAYGGGVCSRYSEGTVFINNIFWNNEAYVEQHEIQIIKNAGDKNPIFSYCDIQGGWTGEGNIDVDPLFEEDSFQLSDSSHCIGTGKDSVEVNGSWYICPSLDYYGQPRPYTGDGYVDLGAIESPYDRVEINDIMADDLTLPLNFELFQNYPNPFNPITMINYQLPMNSYVDLKVFNLLGQKVATLVSENQSPGNHQVQWDASGYPSGIYYYRIEAGEYQQVRKMILLR